MLKNLSAVCGAAALLISLSAAPLLAQEAQKTEKQATAETQKEKDKKAADSKTATTSASGEKQEKTQEKPK